MPDVSDSVSFERVAAGSRPSRAGTTDWPARDSISMPDHVEEEAQALLRLGVSSSTGPRWAMSLIRRARAARRGRRRARRPAACSRLYALLLLARLGAPRAPRRRRSCGDDGGAVGVEHDDVAGRDPRAADDHRHVDRARRRPCVAPRTRIQRAQIGRPISTSSSTSRTAPSTSSPATPRTLAWVASRSPTSATGARLGHREHEHVAGLACGDRGVHHQVVVLPAADGAGRPAAREPGMMLVQVERRRGPRGRRPRRRWRCRVARARRGRSQLRPPPAGARAGTTRRSATSCVPGGAAGVVAALLAALRVVGLEVLLRLHLGHRRDLGLDHRRDVDERGRREVAQLGLVGLEQEQLRRRDRWRRRWRRRRRRRAPRARSTTA